MKDFKRKAKTTTKRYQKLEFQTLKDTTNSPTILPYKNPPRTELAIITSPLSFDNLDDCNPCLAGMSAFLDVEKVASNVSPKSTPSNKFMSSVMSGSSTAPFSFAPNFYGCHTVNFNQH